MYFVFCHYHQPYYSFSPNFSIPPPSRRYSVFTARSWRLRCWQKGGHGNRVVSARLVAVRTTSQSVHDVVVRSLQWWRASRQPVDGGSAAVRLALWPAHVRCLPRRGGSTRQQSSKLTVVDKPSLPVQSKVCRLAAAEQTVWTHWWTVRCMYRCRRGRNVCWVALKDV